MKFSNDLKCFIFRSNFTIHNVCTVIKSTPVVQWHVSSDLRSQIWACYDSLKNAMSMQSTCILNLCLKILACIYRLLARKQVWVFHISPPGEDQLKLKWQVGDKLDCFLQCAMESNCSCKLVSFEKRHHD